MFQQQLKKVLKFSQLLCGLTTFVVFSYSFMSQLWISHQKIPDERGASRLV